MSGSRALSSGPVSRPVGASRSGWNSARPLAPVAALTARVQAGHVPSSHGSGGSNTAARPVSPASSITGASSSATMRHRARVGQHGEIAAHGEPGRLAAAHLEPGEPRSATLA